jgi:hypothetical protein
MNFDGGAIADIASSTNLTMLGSGAELTSQGNNALATLASNEGTLTFNEGYTLTNSGDFANSGVLNVSGPGDQLTVAGQFTNTGNVTIGSGGELAIDGTYEQNGGSMSVEGVLSAAEVDLKGGSLTGTGEIAGLLVNDGVFDPGDPGTVTLDDGYTQNSDGTLVLEFAGSDPTSSYDNLAVTGNVGLSGTLQINLDNGFLPTPGEMFEILAFTGILTGNFTTLNFGTFELGPNNYNYTFQEIVNANDIMLEVVLTPEPSTWFLFGAGLPALGFFEYRRRKKSAMRIQ